MVFVEFRGKAMAQVLRYRSRNLLCHLAGLLVTTICLAQQSEHLQPAPASSRYPDRVLQALGGKRPFSPNDISVPHELPLKVLINDRIGIYGLTVNVQVKGIGNKVLLLDTAGRGLVLKGKPAEGEEIIRAAEWVRSGPGIQTGVFRVFPGLSHQKLSLAPAVAEIFWDRGFQWIDGILATEVFEAWIVRLNFRHRKLLLLPRHAYACLPSQEWPSRLESNWWFVEVEIQGKPACLMLDSGAGRTRVTMRWLQDSLADRIPPSTHTRRPSPPRASFEAGECSISIKGYPAFRRPMMGVTDEQVPALPGIRCDGLLGIDVLKDLVVDLDYKAGKLYLLPRSR